MKDLDTEVVFLIAIAVVAVVGIVCLTILRLNHAI